MHTHKVDKGKKTGQKIPHFISFLLLFYISGLLLFAFLRFILLLYTSDDSISLFNNITLKSFLIGFQFDTVILTYVLITPLILLYFQSILQLKKKYVSKFITGYLCFVSSTIILLTIVDIPYFKFFQNRISESSFQWMGDISVVFNMIISNSANLFFLCFAIMLILFICSGLYYYARSSIIRYDWNTEYIRYSKRYISVCFLFTAFFCVLGMRGSLTHPIRLGDSFYCNNPVLNQIGLNPLFTLFKSMDDKVDLMKGTDAVKITQELLNINSPITSISPIAREFKSDSVMKKHNVVIVLMEGLSANYMEAFGNKNQLTPTLDSLSKVSYFFKNAYSAGIHTNNGVFSTLFSFSALRRLRPMSTVPIRTYSGLPFTLKQKGYMNLFFCPHGEAFDNLGAFIPDNFFDELYTSEDLPSDKIIGPFGVPDDYLFSFAIDKLNRIDPGQPFFTTILTASNHDPYILPEYYKPTTLDKELNAVSYADWSINKFLTEAKKSKWYDNTIFVFVADHGRLVGKNPYDLPLSYNHIPIIIFAPKILEAPKEYDNFIGQVDLFPTIMGILNASFINNTIGVDALKQTRESIYFSADDKLGCINNEWLYIYRYNGKDGLYQYKTGNLENFASSHKQVLEQLKNYALSQTQITEWIISENKTSLVKKN